MPALQRARQIAPRRCRLPLGFKKHGKRWLSRTKIISGLGENLTPFPAPERR